MVKVACNSQSDKDYTIMRNVSLKYYNTLNVESTASIVLFPHNEEGLKQIMENYSQKKIIVLGKGSNILFSKLYYDENYIFVNLKFLDSIHIMDNDKIFVEAGVKLSDLVWFSVEKNLKNIEFLEDIPGTVGGAVIMNAGTYRNTIGKFIYSVRYFDLKKKKIISKKVDDDDFGIRKSYWSLHPTIVISVIISLEKGNYLESLRNIQEDKIKRFQKQPRSYPSAGSVFVRPKIDLKEKVVWELLDEVGLRGFRIGGCAFSDKHPGFIINLGNATYEDILNLVNLAKNKVYEKYNINLETEWKII